MTEMAEGAIKAFGNTAHPDPDPEAGAEAEAEAEALRKVAKMGEVADAWRKAGEAEEWKVAEERKAVEDRKAAEERKAAEDRRKATG